MYIFALAMVPVFIVTAVILRFLIPKLKSLKMGQKILDIGPRWHKSKEGTPTMGGISFIIAITAAVAIYVAVRLIMGGDIKDQLPLIFTFGLALFNGLIGIFDDSVKLTKKQNEGLSASQKLILQILVAALYLVGMGIFGFISTALYLPFIGVNLELGIFYYV
ncbi:MAG: phospho-N-acetylmuramoyl-pentapeptide-transferase, partial [Clostridia bacterium]|nr:phospho-N-acetylmuramoyl-pentapeptide-transferase [Clostridia bacterium]